MFKLPQITFGDYPKEYNPKVHGPYDPGRYYGKPDTPFTQVKLGDLKDWIARRNKSPRAIIAAMSRGHWRWQHKYLQPKRINAAWLLQAICIGMCIHYTANFGKKLVHRHQKYH